MKRLIAIIIPAAMALAASAQDKYNPDFSTYWNQRTTLFQALPTDSASIVFLGNSITDGSEWCELFRNPNCKNRGISGDTADGLLARVGYDLAGQPDKMFIMVGTNDIARGHSLEKIQGNFEALIKKIRTLSPRTRIYVMSVLPVNDCYGAFENHTSKAYMIPQLNDIYKKYCADNGITYVDLFSQFATEDGKMDPALSNDGLHLNGKAYLKWRDYILPLVNE